MFKIKIYWILFTAILLLSVHDLYSLELIELNNKEKVYKINSRLSYYIEDSNNRGIQEISALPDSKWQQGTEFNLGFTNKVLWIKCKIKNNVENVRWVLSYNYYHIDKADLYYKNNSGSWLNKKAGRSYLNSIKDISFSNHGLNLPELEDNIIYLRLESKYSFTLDFTIENKKSFDYSAISHFIFYTIFLAFVLLIIIYNFFIYSLDKDKILLFFALFLLSYFYMVILDSGILYFYLNTSFQNLNHNLLSISSVHLSKSLFVRYYLKVYDYSKTLDRMFKLIILILLLSFIAIPFLPDTLLIQFHDTTTLFNMLLWGYSAVYIYIKGNKQALNLILVWLITFPSILNIILLEHGFISYNFFAVNGPISHLILYILLIQISTMRKLRKDKEDSLNQLKMIVQNSPLITFWLNDSEGKLIYANDIATDKLRVHSNMRPQFFQNFIDNYKEIKQLLEAQSQVKNYEITFYDNDKMRHDGILSSFRFRHNNKITTLTYILDITEFKEVYNEKLSLEDNFTRLNSQIHNSIKGKIDSSRILLDLYLQKSNTILPEIHTVINLLNHCSNESKNMLFVINNKECKLNTLCEELLIKMKLHFSLSNIAYKITNQSESYNNLIIPSHIVQVCLDVFSELLNNITKHSKADVIEVSLEYVNTALKLSVWDNGIGFDYQDVKNKKGSYGISIIESLVNNNNGTIIFEKLDGGMKVQIEFE